MDISPQFEVFIDGKPLRTIAAWGDLSLSFSWPGGCNELSFTVTTNYGTRIASVLRSKPVDLRWAGFVVWSGSILEPEWNGSQVQVTAQGAFKEGSDYAPLDASGLPTDNIYTAVTQAIARGLNWTLDSSVISLSVGSTSAYANVAGVADALASRYGSYWFVDARRVFGFAFSPTDVSYHVRAGAADLGIATDSFASNVVLLYNDSTAGAVRTAIYPTFGSGGVYETTYGHAETMLDRTDLAPMSLATATGIAQAVYERTMQQPGFTNGLELGQGEILDAGWQPIHPARVALEAWGKVVRVHGVPDMALANPYTDFVVGSTSYTAGSSTVTVNPVGLAARDQESVLTEIIEALVKSGALVGDAA